jgi:nitrate reductase beta subunit
MLPTITELLHLLATLLLLMVIYQLTFSLSLAVVEVLVTAAAAVELVDYLRSLLNYLAQQLTAAQLVQVEQAVRELRVLRQQEQQVLIHNSLL